MYRKRYSTNKYIYIYITDHKNMTKTGLYYNLLKKFLLSQGSRRKKLPLRSPACSARKPDAGEWPDGLV